MTADLTIRLCDAADAAMLSLIGGATFLESFGEFIPAADMLAHAQGPHGAAYYAKLLADPDSRCWLATFADTGTAVGYQVLTAPDLPIEAGAADVELKRIYVLSRYHGSGVAWRLMDLAIDAARAMGKTRLLLGVYAGNDRAIGFYRKAGFEMIGDRWFTVGEQQFFDQVMAKDLGV